MTPHILPGIYFVITNKPEEIKDSVKGISIPCVFKNRCQLIVCINKDKNIRKNETKT